MSTVWYRSTGPQAIPLRRTQRRRWLQAAKVSSTKRITVLLGPAGVTRGQPPVSAVVTVWFLHSAGPPGSIEGSWESTQKYNHTRNT